MKKGIFSHRKVNSKSGIKNSVDKLNVASVKRKPWQKEKNYLTEATLNANDDDLQLEKQQSHDDSSSVSCFLKVNDDCDRLMKRMNFAPDELATFIDNELRLAEDRHALMQRELLEKIENLRENVTKVQQVALFFQIKKNLRRLRDMDTVKLSFCVG